MRICTNCDKQPNKAVRLIKLRGKFNPTKTRIQYPNLQWLTVPGKARVLVCTKCKKKALKS